MNTSLWEADFIKALRESYQRYLEKSGRNSAVRAFSSTIGMAPGSFSQLLTGKRSWNLTCERAKEILSRLCLEEKETNRLLSLMGEQTIWKKRTLTENDFPLLTNWLYPAVLFSFDLTAQKKTSEAIAARLRVTREEVETVIADLLKRGMLERRGDDELFRKEIYYSSSDEIPSEAVRRFHHATLDTSKRALEAIPPNERDFTSLTFVGSAEKVDVLKKEVRKLYDLAMGLMCSEDPNAREVFRMSVNLFPMDFSERQERDR